jgi:hypothetical protein
MPSQLFGAVLQPPPTREQIAAGLARQGWKPATPAPTPTTKPPTVKAPGGGVDGPQGITHPKQTSR